MCMIVGYKTKQEAMKNSELQNGICEFALRAKNFVLTKYRVSVKVR